MTQLEVYKKALRLLEKAGLIYDESVFGFATWSAETFYFWALCPLIRVITSGDSRVLSRFKHDSETVLCRKLHEDNNWFTDISKDEPKARAERLEHLKKLIKLYEDEDSSNIPS